MVFGGIIRTCAMWEGGGSQIEGDCGISGLVVMVKGMCLMRLNEIAVVED